MRLRASACRSNITVVVSVTGRAEIFLSAVEDRWCSPGATHFRVLTDDGDRYVLRHTETQDVWSLSAFRSVTRDASPPSDK